MVVVSLAVVARGEHGVKEQLLNRLNQLQTSETQKRDSWELWQ